VKKCVPQSTVRLLRRYPTEISMRVQQHLTIVFKN
jgi:hypothetical protein